MDRVINLMGMGINNPLNPLNMALLHHIVKVHHIIMLPCSPTRVKHKEDIMAKAMVFTVVSLI